MIRKIDGKEFPKRINEYIANGWQIVNIEEVNYFNVKLSKPSGMPIYKKFSKIPFLNIINLEMIQKICEVLNVPYENKSKIDLIDKLEKTYNKGVVETAYESIGIER